MKDEAGDKPLEPVVSESKFTLYSEVLASEGEPISARSEPVLLAEFPAKIVESRIVAALPKVP